jgi:dipeptidyl aminopeptidase/acylaminoacyl peptidase
MKTPFRFFLLFAILFPIVPARCQKPISPAPAAPVQLAKPTIDDLFLTQNLTATLLSPDGKSTLFMIQSDSGVNLWIADGSGGTRALTSGNQVDENPRWSPDGQWLAFKSDRSRKPETAGWHQIWLVSAAGGEATQLTRETFDVRTLAWMPDGKRIVVLASQKAGDTDKDQFAQNNQPDVVGSTREDYCIFLVSVPEGKADLLYKSARPITSFSVSPKGDEIAFADQANWREPEGRFHSVVKVLSISTEKVRTLSGGELSSSGPVYSPDANWIAFQGRPQKNWTVNQSLYVIPASGRAARQIARDFDEDVMQYMWAPDSKNVYFTGAHGMDIALFRVSVDGKITPIYTEQGITRAFSVAGNKISFLHESPSDPSNVFLASIPTKAGTKLDAKQITDLNYGKLRSLAFGKIQTIHWKNKNDGLKLEGQLLTPPDYQPGRSYPLLVVLHGGPNGQVNNGFVLRTELYPLQVFAAEGYVVFLPNPRGSDGYGQKFREMVRKDWGGADFQDIQSGVDDLISRGIVDKNRMGIMGWSYGGYLTAWAVTHTDRFRAASVGAGPVDLFTMYGGTDIPEFMESYFGATPWTATQLYLSHSPMAYVDRVKAATLIQHGAGDGRVPTSISYELYHALKANGVDCELILYPDTWHNVGSPKLVRDGMRRNLDWFNRYVRNAATGTSGSSKETPSNP